MSAIDEYFGKRLGNLQNGMFTATLARIIKVDFEYMRCDVQPLYDDEAKPIADVPFGFMQNDNYVVRFPYKKGDVVFIVFCKEDMAPVLFEDGNREMAAEEQFRQDDAFVVGGLHFFTKPITTIPGAHDESLLICRKDFKSRIEFTQEGKIIIGTNEDIEMNTEKDIKMNAKNIVMTGSAITANGEDLTTDLT